MFTLCDPSNIVASSVISDKAFFRKVMGEITDLTEGYYQAEEMDGSGDCGHMIWADYDFQAAKIIFLDCEFYGVDLDKACELLNSYVDKWLANCPQRNRYIADWSEAAMQFGSAKAYIADHCVNAFYEDWGEKYY